MTDKDLNIEVNIENVKKIVAEVDVSSAGGGTKDHNKLVNRDLENQHPISAITELENELNKLATADSDNYNTLDTKIDDTKADIQQDITNLSNTVQSNYTTLNNKIDTVNQELTSDIDNLAEDVSKDISNLDTKIDTVNQELTNYIDDVSDDLFDLDKYVKEQDTQLQTNINTEATTRANSDTLLQNNINTLTNTVSDNYNTLSGLISNEVTTRTQADTNLQTNIDKKVDIEAGKSLILDSEITRLATLHNYDDTALNQAVNNLSTNKADKSNTYTKDEVDAKVSSVYRACGSVESFSKLPQNAVKGDVYNVLDSGANYVWTGTEWDKLSETIDLTPYQTKQEATNTYQPIINDLATIRVGASKGATALQSIPLASTTTLGGIKAGNWLKVNAETGKLECGELSKTEYDSALGYTFISKTTLENVLSDKDYVKNTDYATGSKAGVFKPSSQYATSVSSNGYLTAQTIQDYSTISNSAFIGKGTLENIKDDLVTSIGNTKYQPIGDYATNTRVDEVENNKTTVIIRSW